MPVLTKINTNSIAEDAITGDKFAGDAYLSNTANQNISGTYSENRLYTSDAYTLSANATVNSHLTLSTVKPTGDVVLTAGGAFTITGTGVLSAGSLLAKERTDLTGMTGELGSTVTGTPAITDAPALIGLGTVTSGTYNSTIGSSATFPVGHILQVRNAISFDDTYTNSSSWNSVSNVVLTITPISATSDIFLMATFGCYTASPYAFFDFYKNASDVTETYNLSTGSLGLTSISDDGVWQNGSISFKDVCAENSVSQKTYKISWRNNASGNTYCGDGNSQGQTLTAFEIVT